LEVSQPSTSTEIQESNFSVQPSEADSSHSVAEPPSEDAHANRSSEDSLQLLCAEIARVRDFATERSASHIAKFAKGLAKVKNETDLIGSLVAMNASLAASRRRGGRIRVQPTSVARRRDGVSRGSRRLAMGRPAKASTERSKRARKRGHKLAASVEANVAHAKSHGSGH
jgi:hypothetical protein